MQNRLIISEVSCQSIINRSRIPGLDYTINPYTGCQHGCIYCYARFMIKYTHHQTEWGSFIDVKINGPEVLKKQLTKLSRGLVSLSTVTDPYQASENRYQITRKILIELLKHRFPVSILTKSNLVLRDIDVLKQFDQNACEVGFSINTLDENIRNHFEPHAPSIQKRIESLKILHKEGIKTWVFLAPILPVLTTNSLNPLLDEIKNNVDYVLVDRLNIKCGNWNRIAKVITKEYPSLFPIWQKNCFSKEKQNACYHDIRKKIDDYCRRNNWRVQFC
ncbi:radical SAM protein [bacterium]|nr:radical SAM protein [bacterium]RQV94382.1 MAG: radical SAM protein [bacterium]